MKLINLISALGCLAAFYCCPTAVEARFGQEQNSGINQLNNCAAGAPGQISGQLATFSGQSISTLLAAAGACAQQDQADKIIDFVKANNLPQQCTDIAVKFRQAEKNVNPFAVKNPCSQICDRLPKNPELLGSVQAFDPACNLQQFFQENPDQKANFDLQKNGAAAGGNQQGGAPPAPAPPPQAPPPPPPAQELPDCANIQPPSPPAPPAPAPAPTQQGNNNGGNNGGAGAAVQCNAKQLEVIVQGRENRFGFDGRQVALNPAIPMENICQQVNAACKQTCDAAKAAAIATGIKGFQDTDPVKLRQMGELADQFNAALGNKSNFAALGGGGNANNNGAAAGGANNNNNGGAGGNNGGAGGNNGGAGANNGGAVQCNAKQLEVIVKGRENRFGVDGQQVALNPAIPIQRICQQVNAACKQTCDAAGAAAVASGIKGFQDTDPVKLQQMGQLADQFNAALGNKSNFAALGGGGQRARNLRAM